MCGSTRPRAPLMDPLSDRSRDDHPDGDRWRTFGMVGGVLLFIVHTEPDPGRIRWAGLSCPPRHGG